jgi:membrane-associated phospholipid phosphatase
MIRRGRVDGREQTPSAMPVRGFVVMGLAALIGLALLVASLDRWIELDDAIWRAVLMARGCGTDRVVERAVTIATGTLALLLVAATVTHVRVVGMRSTWTWLVTWGLGLLVSKTMKHVFTRDRPSALPDLTVGYSFPSAHVMNGVVAMVAIIALTRGFRRGRGWGALAAVAAATLVGGRLMLGRHWATDVLGGALTALVLVGLATPAIARRPLLVPAGLAVLALGLLAFDARLGDGGMRLPSPLVAQGAAVVSVDVGPEMTSPRSGDWREAGLERPFGSYLWLDGAASIVLNVPAYDLGVLAPGRLAFAGRPEKIRGSCLRLDVTLNGRSLARFVPFVGWREYRLTIPRGVLAPGDNELRIAATRAGPSARFGVTYARIEKPRSTAE